MSAIKKIITILVKINNKLFFLSLIAKNYLLSRRKLKILITDKPEWKSMIESGFRRTQHEIHFGEVSANGVGDFDIVIPLTIEEMLQLNNNPAALEKNVIPIPSAQSIHICDDKSLFNKTLIESGYGKYIPNLDTLSYPYILKKRFDAWGQNCYVVENDAQAESLAHLAADPDYFKQKLIPGRYEYATHILFKNNRILASINIQYAFDTETPVKGKDKSVFTKVCSCPHLPLFADILKNIGYQGICCFNYKEEDKLPYIFEINPRVGASLCLYLFSFIPYIEYMEFL